MVENNELLQYTCTVICVNKLFLQYSFSKYQAVSWLYELIILVWYKGSLYTDCCCHSNDNTEYYKDKGNKMWRMVIVVFTVVEITFGHHH